MSHEEVYEFLEENGFLGMTLGFYGPPRLTDNGDGTSSFKRPENPSMFGEEMTRLVNLLKK